MSNEKNEIERRDIFTTMRYDDRPRQPETKTVTVVTETDGQEALYVDGILKMHDETIYASDIAEYAGDGPILFRHVHVDYSTDAWTWPDKLEDLLSIASVL
jgi:hypothetical protein